GRTLAPPGPAALECGDVRRTVMALQAIAHLAYPAHAADDAKQLLALACQHRAAQLHDARLCPHFDRARMGAVAADLAAYARGQHAVGNLVLAQPAPLVPDTT